MQPPLCGKTGGMSDSEKESAAVARAATVETPKGWQECMAHTGEGVTVGWVARDPDEDCPLCFAERCERKMRAAIARAWQLLNNDDGQASTVDGPVLVRASVALGVLEYICGEMAIDGDDAPAADYEADAKAVGQLTAQVGELLDPGAGVTRRPVDEEG
jgi:hypothetical protein